MSREKAAALAAMSAKEKAVYRAKRDARVFWRTLSPDDWRGFCKQMAEWYAKDASGEFDAIVAANAERKKASDEAAIVRDAKYRAEHGRRRPGKK